MLISLNKNKWLYDWLQEKYHDELYAIVTEDDVPRPNKIREGISKILQNRGYRTKVTSQFDVIISMTEKEFIYLKLKYA